MNLRLPEGYHSPLDLKQTEKAIKLVKDFFENALASELYLRRVTAPIIVMKGTGINDDLNGIERPVAFPIRMMNDRQAEVVHSLAKWKRMVLADYGIEKGFGIYTDMNALRPDEDLDNTHSIYVDQWDWERVVEKADRNLDFLKNIVRKIFAVLKRTEFVVFENYPHITPLLPGEIEFIHAEDLLKRYPGLSPRDREREAAREFGAVFVIGIGGALADGEKHDGRAPDYDDWSTPTQQGCKGLNGDIIIWNPILQEPFELSSMGIRVDQEALLRQLEMTGNIERKNLYWHKRLLNGELPLSIGGGIGQSRLCMYFLRKAHIGEVQASIWPEEMIETCQANKIFLM
ncbi:MAG: aspartate--ammonia ligase [Bacteroidales bacterium]